LDRKVEFRWLDGDLRVGRFDVPHHSEEQVGAGVDQIADADSALVGARERDQVFDRQIDAA
jgi:hypothetical protein